MKDDNPKKGVGAVAFKIGFVSQVKPGFARVHLPDLGIDTYWLPVLQQKTHRDKAYWMPDAGDQVSCLLDPHLNEGVILGALYSDVDAPPVASLDKAHMAFADGGHVEYDRETGVLTVNAMGPVNITAAGAATIHAPNVTLDANKTTCTGEMLVKGLITYEGGMTGVGGVDHTAVIDGDLHVTGAISDVMGNSNHHFHTWE
uniref:Phage baseplate assembly protein V n=1 Tax=Candidatus Kentrum sp. TC TaxID=2126339 RepID=A0A450YW76_9GAMM|nr:MAG: phage baseplate assembly protein V [Candidatus Kentron sp. TC]